MSALSVLGKVSTQYVLPEGFDIEDIEEVQFALVMLVQVQEEEYKVITISKETSKVINESELISSWCDAYNLYKSALIKYELGIGAYAEMLSNVDRVRVYAPDYLDNYLVLTRFHDKGDILVILTVDRNKDSDKCYHVDVITKDQDFEDGYDNINNDLKMSYFTLDEALDYFELVCNH